MFPSPLVKGKIGLPKIGYKEREAKMEGDHKKGDGKFLKGNIIL